MRKTEHEMDRLTKGSHRLESTRDEQGAWGQDLLENVHSWGFHRLRVTRWHSDTFGGWGAPSSNDGSSVMPVSVLHCLSWTSTFQLFYNCRNHGICCLINLESELSLPLSHYSLSLFTIEIRTLCFHLNGTFRLPLCLYPDVILGLELQFFHLLCFFRLMFGQGFLSQWIVFNLIFLIQPSWEPF